MSGARQADSGNFPLGQDVEELGPVDLKVVLAESRKLATALGIRASVLRERALSPMIRSLRRDFSVRDLSFRGASLRDYSWREAPTDVRKLLTWAYGQRRMVFAFVLAQLDERIPAVVGARLRAACPSLPWAEPERDEASEPAFQVLAEFAALEQDKQVATARNVALLWDCFVEEFGGVSGFLDAGSPDQSDYLEKLSAAAERMEAGRGTPVAYHYVSVVLMKLYVESFHNRTSNRGAIALSAQVAALVNQGRVIRAQQSKSPIMLVASNDAPAQKPAAAQVEAEKEPTGPAPFRIGYVSQPAMRIGF